MLALNAAEPAQSAQRQHILGRLVYSQSRLARRARWTVVTLWALICFLALRLVLQSFLPQYAFRKDFLQEYTLVRAIADGVDPYLPTGVLAARYLGDLPEAVFPLATPHPPPVGILLLPLSLFDYSTAAVIWFGVELVLLVASVYLVGRALDARLSLWAAAGIAALLLGWHPFWVELALGQLMVPMLALLAGAWLALRSGRRTLGGGLVGLAILIKPVTLPLLLLFVLRKDWRALLGATLVIFWGYLVACWVIGLESLERYLTTVLPLVSHSYRAHAWNLSISSVGWRVFYGTGSEVLVGVVAPPLVRSPAAALVTSVGLLALLLLVACLAVRGERSLDVSLGVMICVSILTMPISWSHYLVLAVIPAAQVIRWLACHRLPSKETNLALIVTMLLIVDWPAITRRLAGPMGGLGDGITHSFAISVLPLMTAVAVGALAWLVAYLGPVESNVSATQHSELCAGGSNRTRGAEKEG